MLTISYNISIRIKDNLRFIETQRKNLLLTPIPPVVKHYLRFETTIEKIYASLHLFGTSSTKKEIAAVLNDANSYTLKRTSKKSQENIDIISYKKGLDYIKEHWLITPLPITVATITDLNAYPTGGKLSVPKEALEELVDYLQTQKDHPVLQAAIAQIMLIKISPFSKGNHRTAMLLGQLLLSKYAYDFRRILPFEKYWLEHKDQFTLIMDRSSIEQNVTPWLEFYTKSIYLQLDRTLEEIKMLSSPDSLSHFLNPALKKLQDMTEPSGSWHLTDRQKAILDTLEDPMSTTTNRKVQKTFAISQITASRDLARLTSLSLLFAHGKGRSVYYTKV